MNILIVENEKALALEMADFLGKEGYVIEHAWKFSSASEKNIYKYLRFYFT
jgi:DNA-binding response OmpR family regulator